MVDCIIRVQVSKATAEAETIGRAFSVLVWRHADN